MNHVHVDNLLDGTFLAIDKAKGGAVYTLSDGVATPCHDFFAYHAKMAGKKRVPTLPAWALNAFLTGSAPILKLFGQKPVASPVAMKFLLRRHRYSIAKAQRELGYNPTISLADGMAEIARSVAP